MRSALLRLFGSVGLCLVLLAGCASPQPTPLRVLSYNIHHGEGMDGRVDLERIAEIIRRSEADLVALQEVDRGVKRTDRVDQPARLAELTGLHVVFERNIEHQGGDYGNAVLSRLPVDRHQNYHLPQSRPGEQRGLLEVHVTLDGKPLVFYATHFDYHPSDEERMASVAVLKEKTAPQSGTPVFVAGDLNDTPDSRVLAAATAFLVDTCEDDSGAVLTYPADAPDKRIDYILTNGHPSVRCVDFRVLPESVASDHRPILAVFEIQTQAK
ncbi:MAG: endonuclease/exonuclease/phosphatase family protein [Phycisphaerae bacterium]|nr:endonuclease/exonuclease/phosphatase family protein [Phycisphaerae bacterium]